MMLVQNPVATDHLPFFVTSPGSTDMLMAVASVFLVGTILAVGVFFFWLHSLPERMVHNKIQYDLVAVLALLSLFTHVHAFWVAALILAFIDLPEFSLPHFSKTLGSMASSLETIAGASTGANAGTAVPASPDAASTAPAPSVRRGSDAPPVASP